MIELGHHLAGAIAGVDLEPHLPRMGDARLAGAPQRLQPAHPAFVAGAARLDPLADPGFLLFPELVEFSIMNRLDLQLLGLLELIGAEVALVFAQLTAIELDDAIGDVVQETSVVGDEKQRAAIIVEQGLQPFDGGEIQMVGRLVQQQQFGVGHQRARQRHPLFQSPRQRFHCRVGIEAQTLQRFFHPAVEPPGVRHFQRMRQPLEIGIDRLIAFRHGMRHGMVFGQQGLCRADAFRHRLEHTVAGLELRLLGHIGQLQARRAPHLARIRQALAGNDLQQTGFARAVAADQADPLARLDHQRSAIEQRPVAIGQFKSVKRKEGHGMDDETTSAELSAIEGRMDGSRNI